MSDSGDRLSSLRSRRSDECVSDFEIDHLLVGDLPAGDAEEVKRRIESCEHCQRRVAELEAEQQAFAARPTPIWLGRPKPRNFAGIAVAITAVAAAALLFVRPGGEDPGTIRLKGGDRFGYVVVAPDGTVRGDQDSAVVLPGDELQWRFRTVSDRYVAVLSKDPAGTVSVYYPDGPQAELVRAGPERTLPIAVRLDATVGEETLYGLVCTEPVELAPVRASLETGGRDFPPECDVQEYTLQKRSSP
jgi:hypothetical protein